MDKNQNLNCSIAAEQKEEELPLICFVTSLIQTFTLYSHNVHFQIPPHPKLSLRSCDELWSPQEQLLVMKPAFVCFPLLHPPPATSRAPPPIAFNKNKYNSSPTFCLLHHHHDQPWEEQGGRLSLQLSSQFDKTLKWDAFWFGQKKGSFRIV